ncbi:MAG: hypothetical protein RJB11_1357, partial [Planctomycetota bacterium]
MRRTITASVRRIILCPVPFGVCLFGDVMSIRFYSRCAIALCVFLVQIHLPSADAQPQSQSVDLPRKPLLHLDAEHLARVLGQSQPGQQPVVFWPDAQ